MDKNIAKVWTFKSESNPDKTYETLQYVDGSTSCNCPGWTKRAIRTCKHTRFVDQGIADSNCTSSHEYDAPVKAAKPAQHIQTTVKVKQAPPEKLKAPPARKINWN